MPQEQDVHTLSQFQRLTVKLLNELAEQTRRSNNLAELELKQRADAQASEAETDAAGLARRVAAAQAENESRLRDNFASSAMNGFLAGRNVVAQSHTLSDLATKSYAVADALLAAR